MNGAAEYFEGLVLFPYGIVAGRTAIKEAPIQPQTFHTFAFGMRYDTNSDECHTPMLTGIRR